MSQLHWTTIIKYQDAPTTCGVYQYWNNDTLLYIGKAINLKARLASHAQNAKLDDKEHAIVSSATKIKYTEVDSEFLALLLEARLIREHQPPYNRIWKDDKSYLYIVIDTKEDFPRPRFARAHELIHYPLPITHYKTFGPFPSSKVAEEVLRSIRRLIPFCMLKNLGDKTPACFYSKIGLCNPCPAAIKKQSKIIYQQQKIIYRKQIFQVIKILSGNIDPVIKQLTRQIKDASKKQDFETALELRNKITSFTRYLSTHRFADNYDLYNTSAQKITALNALLITHYPSLSPNPRIECYDASNNAMLDSTVSMVVSIDGLIDRGEYRRFKIRDPHINNDFDRLKEALMRRLKNKTWPKPDLIVIDGGVPQLKRLQTIFDQLPEPIAYLGLAKHPDHLVIPKDLQGVTLKVTEYANVQPDRYNLGFRHLQELRDEAHRFANNYRKILAAKRTKIG